MLTVFSKRGFEALYTRIEFELRFIARVSKGHRSALDVDSGTSGVGVWRRWRGVGVAWCESVSTSEAPRLAPTLLTEVALYLYQLTTIASGLRLEL